MPDDLAHGQWELHTLQDMRWNENHQCPIKYWSRDIVKSMRWLKRHTAYAEHAIYATQCCFNSAMPPKRLYTGMHTADWGWDSHVRRDSRGQYRGNRRLDNTQSEGYNGSFDIHVQCNTSLEFCWRQDSVACLYDNWQSIVKQPPYTLNTLRRNGRSPADSDQQPRYFSETAGLAEANIPRVVE
jgi:hypothetical protein